MKILVTGATGYIGGVVAEALTRAGHEVAALIRDDRAATALRARGLAPVRGDLRDPVALARVADDADAVVWAATANREDVDAPAIAAVLATYAGSARPFLYTSGVWVHGDTGGAIADEDTPLRPAELVAWRPAVERAVLGTAGIRGVVIRPGIVYGRGGGIPGTLVATARAGDAVRVVGDGANRWPVVFVDDLADLYRRAVERAPAGTVLLAVEGPSIPARDVAAAACDGAGRGRVTPWPLTDARVALGPFADALALDQQFSARRARDLLGWTPRGPGILADLRAGSTSACNPAPSPAS